MKAFRDIRIIPVVLVAIGGLAVLKIAGIVIDGGYVLAERTEAPRKSWAQNALNFPGGGDPADITGSMPSAPKGDAKPPSGPALKPPDTVRPAEQIAQPAEQGPTIPAAERAVLERLQTRRQELEARAREIDIRENLLKSAEKRIEAKVEEMRASEARIANVSEQKTQTDSVRLKGLVTMYEGMKPKDAARIFDRLEMPVLIEIAAQIAPRKMSDVMGQMSAEAAERLTVELARRGVGDRPAAGSAELPKIEGKPTAAN